ncbi:MAG: amino acid ABC transporter substrate-binding protein [Candidatus Bathyarchaeia archaeon]
MKKAREISAIAKMTWIAIVVIIVAVAAIVSVYIIMSTKPPRDRFRIGVLIEITGAWAREGNMVKRGYDAWRDYINENLGGLEIDGKKYLIEYVYYDLKSDPATAADAMEKMITTEDIDWVWGPMASACVLAEGAVGDKYGMLQIDGTCESHLIPERKYKWFFMLQPITKTTGAAYAYMLKLEPSIQTVALLYSDSAYNLGLGEGFKIGISKMKSEGYNINIVYEEVFSDAITDLSSQILEAKASNADALILFSYANTGLVAVRNMQELEYNPKFFATNNMGVPDFYLALGESANYICCAVPWTSKVIYSWESILWHNNSYYVQYFETKFGIDADYSSAGCAAAGEIMAELLIEFKMKPPLSQADREKIRNELEKRTFYTFWGPVKFSTDDVYWHSNTELELIPTQYMNGRLTMIGGPSKEEDLVFPKPPWP